MAKIAFEDFDGGAVNLINTDNVFDYDAGEGALGDVFGRVDGSTTGMPFDVVDDTVADISGGGIRPSDTLGLAGQNTSTLLLSMALRPKPALICKSLKSGLVRVVMT